ncbi:alpha/beta fold hydrolase [Acidobacteriota bacterium]
MKRFSILTLAIAIGLALQISCKSKESPIGELPEQRESIHDRVVHIEPELITDIPETFRWCNRLELKKHRINVGDAKLYVEEEGKGIPLVLINGGPGGTHHYFHPWFSRAKSYARVIYYDQRGCGLSDFTPGEEGYSVKQAVDDLDAIRQALNIKKWVVLGYSYGGFLGQYYMINYPEHMAGLILLGASPGMWEGTGDSRQGDFISDDEKTRLKELRKDIQQLAKETDMSRKRYIQLLIYNNHMNGDWKRQNYYKPSAERMAQMALYEWDNDENFNQILNSSENKIDLTGAFDSNPIPTLILEGKWDLTWSEKKAGILHKNHPKAKIVMFEKAGHGIYDEEPEQFFSVLEDFLQNLPVAEPKEIADYKQVLKDWDKKRKASPDYMVESIGWGWKSSLKISEQYTRERLDKFDNPTMFMRIGFGLYDDKKYDEACYVFTRMQHVAAKGKSPAQEAAALIWQGHMFDLLGKRNEAIKRYRLAADMNIDDTWMHGQYDLQYSLSSYAAERIQKPFQRIDNIIPD